MAEVFYRNDNRSSFGYGVINNAYDYFNGSVQITEPENFDVNSLIRFVCNSQDWGYLWVDYEDYLEVIRGGYIDLIYQNLMRVMFCYIIQLF